MSYNIFGANEVFQYSFEEQLTGKTWVDGKPIYRKTWAVPDAPSAGAVIIIPIGFSVGLFFKILDGGVLRAVNNDYVPLPYSDPDSPSHGIRVYSNPAKDQIIIGCGSTADHDGGWITIEYTKA